MVPTLFYELSMIDEMMTITEKYYRDVQHFFSFNFFFQFEEEDGRKMQPVRHIGLQTHLLASSFTTENMEWFLSLTLPILNCHGEAHSKPLSIWDPNVSTNIFFSFKTKVSQIINFLFQSFFKQIFIQFKKVTPVFTYCKRRKGRFYFSRCSFAMMVR